MTMHKLRQYGVTFLELVIAMVVASILVTTLFMTWNQMNRHIIVQKRRGVLQSATNSFSQTITSKIGRSQSVLEITDSRISFVNPDSADTITYSFDGVAFMRNDSLYQPPVAGTHVSAFRIRTENESLPGGHSVLLEIAITVSNSMGDSICLVSTVNTKFPDNSIKDGIDEWYF